MCVFICQAIAVLTTVAVFAVVNAQTQRGGPFVVASEQHSGELERQYSTSAENYGRPARSEQEHLARYDMAYGGTSGEFGLKLDAFAPLIYMPMLPLMVIFLRSRVSKDKLNKILLATIGVSLCHAGYILFGDSTMHGA